MRHHELRWGGFAGIAFVVLSLVAYFLPGTPERVDSAANTIASYVGGNRTAMLVGALMWAAAAVFLLWFIAAFTEALRERAEHTDVHLALLAGGVLVAGAIFAFAALNGTMAWGVDGRAAELTTLMYEGGAILTALIGFGAAMPLAAAAVGIMRTHVMPNWLGWFAALAAVVSAISALGVFVETGAWVPGGPIMGMIPLLLSSLWVVSTSVFMVREHLPEIRAAEPMPQMPPS